MDKEMIIPKVSEIIVKNVIAFHADHSTSDVVRVFNEHRISMDGIPLPDNRFEE